MQHQYIWINYDTVENKIKQNIVLAIQFQVYLNTKPIDSETMQSLPWSNIIPCFIILNPHLMENVYYKMFPSTKSFNLWPNRISRNCLYVALIQWWAIIKTYTTNVTKTQADNQQCSCTQKVLICDYASQVFRNVLITA